MLYASPFISIPFYDCVIWWTQPSEVCAHLKFHHCVICDVVDPTSLSLTKLYLSPGHDLTALKISGFVYFNERVQFLSKLLHKARGLFYKSVENFSVGKIWPPFCSQHVCTRCCSPTFREPFSLPCGRWQDSARSKLRT